MSLSFLIGALIGSAISVFFGRAAMAVVAAALRKLWLAWDGGR